MVTEDLILNTLLELKKVVGNLEGKLDAHVQAHSDRLENLESDSKWQWRVSLATVPLIAALHQIASRIGLTRG